MMLLFSACKTQPPREPAQASPSQAVPIEPAVLFTSLPNSALIDSRIHQSNLVAATMGRRFFCFNKVDKSTVEYPASAIYTNRRSAYLYVDDRLACKAIDNQNPAEATRQIEATLQIK